MITPHGHGKNTETYAGIYLSEQERIEGEVGERNVAVQAVQMVLLQLLLLREVSGRLVPRKIRQKIYRIPVVHY